MESIAFLSLDGDREPPSLGQIISSTTVGLDVDFFFFVP